jgi:phytoene/squalene synthetase
MNSDAFEAFLDTLIDPDPARVALARTLAAALDAGAGLATAAVSREYRATLAELAASDDSDVDPADAWLAGLSAPVLDPPESD